jgi:hypothetical protein
MLTTGRFEQVARKLRAPGYIATYHILNTRGKEGSQRMAFGLQYELPGETLPQAWRVVIAEQAGLLETMLCSVHNAVEAVKKRTDLSAHDMAKRLTDIAHETAQQLSHLAQQSMVVEQQIGRLIVQLQTADTCSPDMLHRMQVIEQVNSILHANITISRRLLETMVR